MVELNTAVSETDYADVYQFWYDVYVSEMGRHLHDANTSHQYRRLFDPLANAGSLCIARHEGKVVGTVLSTPLAHPAAGKYKALYKLTDLSAEELSASAITTKLMVAPAQRQTRLPLRLAFATYDWGLHVGIKHNYIDCNDHLLRLFTRLGYTEHLPLLHLKEYGRVNSLRLDITDEQHLQRVGSPFLSFLRRFNRQQGLITSPSQEQETLSARARAAEAKVPDSIVEAFKNYQPRPMPRRPTRPPVSRAS